MEIKTPRGRVFINKETMRAELEWNPEFANRINRDFGTGSRLQKFIDSEYMRSVEPYMPFKTGMMIKSMTLGTIIGSGIVRVIAPYSMTQFLYGRKPGTGQTGALRGRDWHERWKADNLTSFVETVRSFVRRGG